MECSAAPVEIPPVREAKQNGGAGICISILISFDSPQLGLVLLMAQDNFMRSHPAQQQSLLELLGFLHTPPAVGYIPP